MPGAQGHRREAKGTQWDTKRDNLSRSSGAASQVELASSTGGFKRDGDIANYGGEAAPDMLAPVA